MRHIGKITKYIALFLFGSIFCITVAVVLFYQSGIPQNTIRQIIEVELSRAFQWQVSIDELSGNLITGATARNVRFQNHTLFPGVTLMEAGEVEVNYSLISVIQHGGDFAAAVSSIHLKDVKLNVIRNKDDKWTFLHIFPPPKEGVPAAPPTFTGKIFFRNVVTYFKDERGWGKTLLERPFEDYFIFSSAYLDYTKIEDTKIRADGRLYSNKTPVRIEGSINSYNGRFNLSFLVHPALDKWGSYVFPFEGFSLQNGTPVIQGRIISKHYVPVNELPFWYNLDMRFNDGEFGLPYFAQPITNIDGDLSLVHGFIPVQHFEEIASIFPQISSRGIWTLLVQQKIINENGMIIPENWGPIRTSGELDLPAHYDKVERLVFEKLAVPTTFLFIKEFDGEMNRIPVYGSGALFLHKGEISLTIKSRQSYLERMIELFPAIAKWKVSGPGSTSFVVSGALANPVVKGTLQSPLAQVYAFSPDNLLATYQFQNRVLEFSLLKGNLHGGTVYGSGKVFMDRPVTELAVYLNADNIQSRSILPNTDYVAGSFDLRSRFYGPTTRFEGDLTLSSSDFTIYNQAVRSGEIDITVVNNEDILVNEARFYVNNGAEPLRFSGRIDDLMHMNLVYRGSGIPILDPDPNRQDGTAGRLTVSGDLLADLTPRFWRTPLDEIRSQFDAEVRNFTFYNQYFDRVTIDGNLRYNRLFLDELRGTGQFGNIRITGELYAMRPEHLSVRLDNFDMSASDFFQQYVPEALKPFGGKLTLTMDIRQHHQSFPSPPIGFAPALRNYIITANMQVRDGYVQSQPIERASAEFFWNGDMITVRSAEIFQGESHIALSGSVSSRGILDLELAPSTRVRFEDFELVTIPYGNIMGTLFVDGGITGHFRNPNFNIFFRGDNIATSFLELDSIDGRLIYDGTTLTVQDISIREGRGLYVIDGTVNLSSILGQEELDYTSWIYDLNLRISNARLTSFTEIVEGLVKEIRSRTVRGRQTLAAEDSVNGTALQGFEAEDFVIRDPRFGTENIVLYRYDNPDTPVGLYSLIEAEQEQLQDPGDLGLANLFKGELTASVNITSREDRNAIINGDILIDDAEVGFVSANRMRLQFNSENETIQFSLFIYEGIIGGQTFEEFHSQGFIDERQYLNITQTDITTDGRMSGGVFEGQIPLAPYWDESRRNEEMRIVFNLEGDNLGVLAMFIDAVKTIKNDGYVSLIVSGPLHQPVLRSRIIDLVNAQVFLADGSLFSSPFVINTDEIVITNNQVVIPDVTMVWQGPDTDGKLNTLTVDGTVGFNQIDFLSLGKLVLDFRLTAEDTTLYMNNPNLFHGEITLRNSSLRGPYIIPISATEKELMQLRYIQNNEMGPVLASRVEIRNGEIAPPTGGQKPPKPHMLLNVNFYMGQDVSVSGSLFGQNLFAGIAGSFDLLFRESLEPLIIRGSLNYPRINRRLILADGNISLFNQNFELLEPDMQRIFYEQSQYRIHENSILFDLRQLEDERYHLIPILDISAYSVVDNYASSTATQDVFVNDAARRAIVISIKGPITDLNSLLIEEYEMRSAFPRFGEVTYVNSYSLTEGPSSLGAGETTGLARLLVPGFQSDTSQTTELINILGEQQINTLVRRQFLRPLEREIAQNIGLYDLRIDYNVGGAVLRGASNVTGISGLGEEQETVGFNFTKLLTDQLYLRVKTDLDLASERRDSVRSPFSLSEIELRYYLLPNLSLSYDNIEDDEGRTRQSKYSLQYSYEF